jgi:hypothetical protein
VEVLWEDSAQVGNWHHEEDIPPIGPIRSVGLLYREDDTALVLIQSLNLTEDGPEVRTAKLAGSLVIPRSAIREVRELRRHATQRTR